MRTSAVSDYLRKEGLKLSLLRGRFLYLVFMIKFKRQQLNHKMRSWQRPVIRQLRRDARFSKVHRCGSENSQITGENGRFLIRILCVNHMRANQDTISRFLSVHSVNLNLNWTALAGE